MSKKWSQPKGRKSNYDYAAGITRKFGEDWIWQGYVSAKNKKQAQKLLKKYANRNYGKNNTVHITTEMKSKTKAKTGRVYTIK